MCFSRSVPGDSLKLDQCENDFGGGRETRTQKKGRTTWNVQNPANDGINYLSTGAGFLPSTVWFLGVHWFGGLGG